MSPKFFSYTCPACHASNDYKTLINLKDNLIKKNIASIKYSHLPLNPVDVKLGIAHRCFVLSHEDSYIKNIGIAQIFNDSKEQFMKTINDENDLNKVLDNIVLNQVQIPHYYYDCIESLLSEDDAFDDAFNEFEFDYRNKQRSEANKYMINGTPYFIIEKKCYPEGKYNQASSALSTKDVISALNELKDTSDFLEKGFDDPCQPNWFLRTLKYLKWFSR